MYYFRRDHLGNNVAVWNAETNTTPQRTFYYASGLPMSMSTGLDLQNRKYNGKEFEETSGLNEYDNEARHYYPAICRTTTMDPLCEQYYPLSPYAWCGNNFANAIDPDGNKWFYYHKGEDEDVRPEYFWEDEDFYYELDDNGLKVRIDGYDAVVVFEGYYDEKLGEGNNLFGKGAKLAKATVYGPKGKDDITTYDAFTMSSYFDEFGAINNGDYDVYYDKKGKSGKIKSHWSVEKRAPVDCLYGINYAFLHGYPDAYSKTQKDKIWIHRSNTDGSMLFKNSNGTYCGVSTGCPIIVPSIYNKGKLIKRGWDQFDQQLQGLHKFHMVIKRK